MIVFMPHIFGDAIYDGIEQIKEFETAEEMKEYLCNFWNINNNISKDNIIIDELMSYKDERLDWEDTRYVCLTTNGTSRCIGYCATKYKNLNETINKLKTEKMENDLLTYLHFIITNMGCINEYHLGEYAEQRVCLFKKDNLWQVYSAKRGNIFDKSVNEELFDACIEVIRQLADSKEVYEKNKENFSKAKTLIPPKQNNQQ